MIQKTTNEIEKFMKYQIVFNKKVLQHIRAMHDRIRNCRRTLMSPESLEEIIEHQNKLLKEMLCYDTEIKR